MPLASLRAYGRGDFFGAHGLPVHRVAFAPPARTTLLAGRHLPPPLPACMAVHGRHGGRPHRSLRGGQSRAAHQASSRHRALPALLRQLALHRFRSKLLRRHWLALAAHTAVVCVLGCPALPPLGDGGMAGGQAGSPPIAHLGPPARLAGRPCLAGGHGAALQPRRRPFPRLLRHRQPRLLLPRRRLAGRGVVAQLGGLQGPRLCLCLAPFAFAQSPWSFWRLCCREARSFPRGRSTPGGTGFSVGHAGGFSTGAVWAW